MYGPFNIGFNFCFFDSTYSQFYIGSNGWIGFSGAPAAGTFDPYITTTVPNTGTGTPKNCIMGPWKDWQPAVAPTPGQYVFYQVVGTAPDQKLVVSYSNIPMFNCNSTIAKFQIVLYQTTNVIETNFVNMTVCMTWPSGTPGVGVHAIHNLPGTVAYVVPGRNNTVFTALNETTRWIPSGPSAISNVAWYIGPTQVDRRYIPG